MTIDPVDSSSRQTPDRPLRRTGVRKPTERVRRAVLESAREIIGSRGFSAFTVDELVSRSGISKMTIYRWWSNRSAVAMDVLLDEAGPNEPILHEGSALDNLRTHLENAGRFIAGQSGALLAGIVADAQHNEELSNALRTRYLSKRRSMTVELLRRAVQEGDLRPDVDPEVIVDLLIGPLYYRLLLRHLPVDDNTALELLDVVLDGVSTSPGAHRSAPRNRQG